MVDNYAALRARRNKLLFASYRIGINNPLYGLLNARINRINKKLRRYA